MTFDPNSQDQLAQYFLQEVTELLDTIEQNLYGILEDKTTDKVHTLMRSAHTIKGSAANLELKTIESIAHHLEDVFQSLYAEDLEIDPELGSLLLEGYECLRHPLAATLAGTDYDETVTLDQTASVFAKLQDKLGDFFGREAPIPSSEELGFDVVGSIFEDSISQELQELEQVISEGDIQQITDKILYLAEFLQNIGFSYDLPGLNAIADATVRAIDRNPDDIVSVAIAALENFCQAQEDIKIGDRVYGGKLSNQLRQLAQISEEQTVLTESNGKNIEESLDLPPNLTETANDIDPPQEITEPFETVGFSTANDIDLSQEITEPFETVGFSTANDIDLSQEITEPFETVGFSTANDIDLSEEITEPFETVGFSTTDKSMTESNSPEAKSHQPKTDKIDLEQLNYRPETDNPQENSDSEVFATLFDNQNPTQTKIAEVLEPTQSNTNTNIPSMDRILQSIWIAEPEEKVEFAPTPAKSSSLKDVDSNVTIRVALKQLDNLSNAMGELLIDENLQTLQAEQLHNSSRQTLQQYLLCQQQLNEIYDWWDKQFLRARHRKRARHNYNQQSFTENRLISQSQDFDPLEMDVYSDLHVLLQSFNQKINQLGEQIETIEKFTSESRFNTVKRKQALSQAQDNLLQARMVSLGVILDRFPRMLKQMVASHKKPAELQLKGTEIFIDKAISDKLYEPLLHLVRNAYDHGLEDPETRIKQNKPETGTISIRAYNQGNRTFIEIEDDGRGLDWQRIREKAVAQGILIDGEYASESKLAELLFQPGFSTAESVSKLSGRGVGLDVVRNQIENIGGRIFLDSQVAKGSKFTLQLPLNLTTARLLICQAQGIVYGILSDSITRIIVPQKDQITTQASAFGQSSQSFLRWQSSEHQTLIPIADIGNCITYQYPLVERNTNSALKTFPIKKAYRVPPLLLLENQGEYMCLRVDEIVVEQELVIKSLGGIIDLPDYIQGYAVLGDGSFTLVIEPDGLLNRSWEQITNVNSQVEVVSNTNTLPPANDSLENDSVEEDNILNSIHRYKVMVIEDSIVQRQSLVMTLTKSNYEVVEAGDGVEALEKLAANKDISLIICDVEMPKMNGFEFLSKRRKNSNFLQIPVIMVTTRSSDKHQKLAFSLGANEYHTKPYSDSILLDTVSQLIESSNSLVATP